MNRLEVGTDAMDFVKDIPDQYWKKIDTVVWDPPYYDDDNPEHLEKVNGRTKLKSTDPKKGGYQRTEFNYSDSPDTRLMNKLHRQNILEYIQSKLNEDSHILYFHTQEVIIYPLACKHIWVKTIRDTMAGNNDRNNGEYVYIMGKKIEGKIKGRILNKYINAKFPTIMPRSCAKPLFLYKELYRHLDSKFILDPFAGYGNSIHAARKMNIPIFACDIDDSLIWDKQVNWDEWLEA